jgi:O-antigen/teichoic acid export membrane protein
MVGLVTGNLDRLLINRYQSLALLGNYALATKFSSLLEFLVGEPFNRSYGAFRFSIMKEADAGLIHSRIVRYLFLLTVTLALGIGFFANDLLRVMSKPDYWNAVDVLPLLLLASSFTILGYPFQTGVMYAKKTRYLFYVQLLAGGVSLVSNLLLIPRFGVWGACTTQLLCGITAAAATDRISQRFFPVSYDVRSMATTLAVAAVAYGLSLLVGTRSLPVEIAMKGSIFLAFLACLVATGSVTREEFAWLRRRLGGGGGGAA